MFILILYGEYWSSNLSPGLFSLCSGVNVSSDVIPYRSICVIGVSAFLLVSKFGYGASIFNVFVDHLSERWARVG